MCKKTFHLWQLICGNLKRYLGGITWQEERSIGRVTRLGNRIPALLNSASACVRYWSHSSRKWAAACDRPAIRCKCWMLNVARALYPTGCNAVLLSGLLAGIRRCFVFCPYMVTRDCSTINILIPYRYITQCRIIANGMSCLFNSLGITGE